MSDIADKIEFAKYPVLIAPFAGASLAVKCKRLSTAQKMVCGTFSIVETVEDKIQAKMHTSVSLKELDEYSRYHYEILRAVLVDPSFDYLIKKCQEDFGAQESIKELDAMLKQIEQLPSNVTKKEFTEELLKMKIRVHYVLPDDFVHTILNFALGKDTIVEGLTDKMFVEAAILAEQGHDNPIDHIDPEKDFLPVVREDINRRARYMLAMERSGGC